MNLYRRLPSEPHDTDSPGKKTIKDGRQTNAIGVNFLLYLLTFYFTFGKITVSLKRESSKFLETSSLFDLN